jgi:hypothetical protein
VKRVRALSADAILRVDIPGVAGKPGQNVARSIEGGEGVGLENNLFRIAEDSTGACVLLSEDPSKTWTNRGRIRDVEIE